MFGHVRVTSPAVGVVTVTVYVVRVEPVVRACAIRVALPLICPWIAKLMTRHLGRHRRRLLDLE